MNKIYNFLVLFQKIVYFIKDLFYFSVCSYCKINISNIDRKYLYLCQKCISSISYIAPIKHKKTFFSVYALGNYNGLLRYVVTEKYRKSSMGYEIVNDKIINMISEFKIDFDCILPVPKTAMNKLKHKLNQTLIIAENISSYYKKEVFDCLCTRRNKEDQAGKRFKDRLSMENDIFFIPDSQKSILTKKKILIVDDVYTTGKTIDNILYALSEINYESISVLVIARK
jgi:competence protein ComFC